MKKSTKKGWKIVGIVFCVVILLLAIACGMVFGGVFTHKPGGQDAACKVLQITDVHILNNAKKDQKAFRTITQMIEASRPDIIVVTGDITSEDENMRAFRTFGEFMESFNIPWASSMATMMRKHAVRTRKHSFRNTWSRWNIAFLTAVQRM